MAEFVKSSRYLSLQLCGCLGCIFGKSPAPTFLRRAKAQSKTQPLPLREVEQAANRFLARQSTLP